jgi:hypothetical protein
MRTYNIFIICNFLFIYNCFAQANHQYKGYDKILVLYHSHYTEETKYKILNEDKSLFAEIKSINGNEPSCELLKDKIFAYYDTYFIFHFFAKNDGKDANYYNAKVGNSNKMIHKDSTLLEMSFEDYLKKYYCKASASNPLRVKPNINSEKIKANYSKLFFSCLKIKGDWTYVECLGRCSKPIRGWLRWKNDSSIILDVPYIY